jgi:MoxR-like ATPase
VSYTRGLDLDKPPGVAETIDWVSALVALGVAELMDTGTERGLAGLGALAKTPDDFASISEAVAEYSSQ